MDNIKEINEIIEKRIKLLREQTPNIKFNPNELAEIEINKFFFENSIVDRIMIVLRANGCEHYKKSGGCSMCSHFTGVDREIVVSTNNYIRQWDSIVSDSNINLDNYPVVCVYNLGSFLNANEITTEAVEYIFKSLTTYKQVKKVIIESRAEYVKKDILKKIRNVYTTGIVEVGIGVESTNYEIRNLCHHKSLDDLEIIKESIKILHENNCKALAYVNLKPVFLTESEAIKDAILTCVDCFNMGFDAVSIEPTSLQNYSLANYLYEIGEYRVPWLLSVRDVIEGIYAKLNNKKLDIRIGGYFEEEVLSGSQGVGYDGKNELFPHMTSLNCSKCSKEFIQCIKKFNQTYDLNELYKIKNCDICYSMWQNTKNIKDSRTLSVRIKDTLG